LLQRTLDGFHKSQAYGKDKSTLRIASSLVTFVVDGLFLLAGGYPFAWDLARKAVRDWQLVRRDPVDFHLLFQRVFMHCLPFQPDSDDITTSLLWTGLLITFDHLYHLPLELYRIFVIEERHGFNKQTIGMFVADELKQAFLLVVIGGPILALVIKVILWGGEHFYVYVYAVVFVVQVVMVVLYPTLIAPLFNKFTPLENGDLKAAIERLAESQKSVRRVMGPPHIVFIFQCVTCHDCVSVTAGSPFASCTSWMPAGDLDTPTPTFMDSVTTSALCCMTHC
jgi:STE24 endopeptidase